MINLMLLRLAGTIMGLLPMDKDSGLISFVCGMSAFPSYQILYAKSMASSCIQLIRRGIGLERRRPSRLSATLISSPRPMTSSIQRLSGGCLKVLLRRASVASGTRLCLQVTWLGLTEGFLSVTDTNAETNNGRYQRRRQSGLP